MSKMVPVRMSEELVGRIDAKTENRSAFIVTAIEAKLSGSQEIPKPTKMIIDPKPRAILNPIEREVEETSPKVRATKLAPCPRCDGPTVAWGPMRRCNDCQQNFPV